MIRSASRGARVLTEHLGRQQASSLRLNCRVTTSAIGSRTSFSTRECDDVFTPLSGHATFREYPQPLPAVAYVYDYDEGHENDMEESTKRSSISKDQYSVRNDVASRGLDMPLSSAAGGSSGRGPSSVTPYPPPSSMVSAKGGPARKVGGGGSGRHRCPKCGTTVTFRCDYEENTFYCASCSGWFVINPNTVMVTEDDKVDGSPYEEFMARNGPRRTADPEILMRHVSLTG